MSNQPTNLPESKAPEKAPEASSVLDIPDPLKDQRSNARLLLASIEPTIRKAVDEKGFIGVSVVIVVDERYQLTYHRHPDMNSTEEYKKKTAAFRFWTWVSQQLYYEAGRLRKNMNNFLQLSEDKA